MEYGDDILAYDVAASDIATASGDSNGSFACCALCGSVNAPGDMFCGECGHGLEEEAPSEDHAAGGDAGGAVRAAAGTADYGIDANAYEMAAAVTPDATGAAAAVGYGADTNAYEMASSAPAAPPAVKPRKKAPPPSVAPRKKKAPVAVPEETYAVAGSDAAGERDGDGAKGEGYSGGTNAYEMATTTEFPRKPDRSAKKAVVGYGNDANAYDMAGDGGDDDD
eukprot:gene16376-3109_t